MIKDRSAEACNNTKFTRPIRLSLLYFFGSHRWLRGLSYLIGLGVFFAFVSLVPLFVWVLAYLLGVSIDLSTGWATSAAALLGAVIGVMGGGVGAYFLQAQQNSAAAAIRRKRDIYEPLHEELLRLHKSITAYSFGCFPFRYRVSNDSGAASHDDVEYYWWTESRSKSLGIGVANWLKQALDCHLIELVTYGEKRQAAMSAAQRLTVEFLRRNYNRPYEMKHGQPAERLLNDLILRNTTQARSHFHAGNLPDLTGHQYEQMFIDLSNAIWNLEEVKSLIAHQGAIENHTSWLMDELQALNQYISLRYEELDGLL